MTTETALDLDYASFVHSVRRLLGIDLNGYKRDQMQRRLRALAQRYGVANLAGFASAMERDPAALTAFKDFFTINVSEFLRDPPRWQDLLDKALPRLFAEGGRRALHCWSAGCSYGAEPYTLSLLLEERAPALTHRIIATDIDETILARAREGVRYQESDLRAIDAARRERFFMREGGGSWAVRPGVKGRVRFLKHDLMSPPPERNLDLIVCRNVVIYFTEEAKRKLYQRMFEALRPGGMLFVGATEVVAGAREMGYEPYLTSFYRKPAARLADAG